MRWVGLVVLLLGVTFLGCGDEEVGCRSDHDCEGELICEPAGCRRACETAEDCPAGQACVPRRVEPGRMCEV